MFKKIILIISALLFILSFASCSAATKTVTCDNCGKEIEVAENSNVNENWGIFCEECEEELGMIIAEE